jgi:hypothetical protein
MPLFDIILSLLRGLRETSEEIPSEIYGWHSFPIPVGLPFFERRFSKSRQGRLGFCLLEDEVLLLDDRSQNGRAVCVGN